MGHSAGENCVDCPGQPPLRLGAKYTEWFRPGVISSLLLHALAAFLLLSRLNTLPETLAPVVPVDVVQLAEETTSPPPLQKAAGPQQQKAAAPPKRAQELASRELPSFRPPTGIAPAEPQPPPDRSTATPRRASDPARGIGETSPARDKRPVGNLRPLRKQQWNGARSGSGL